MHFIFLKNNEYFVSFELGLFCIAVNVIDQLHVQCNSLAQYMYIKHTGTSTCNMACLLKYY